MEVKQRDVDFVCGAYGISSEVFWANLSRHSGREYNAKLLLICILHDYHGLSLAVIARMLDRAPSTVGRSYHMAKETYCFGSYDFYAKYLEYESHKHEEYQ